jgi:hypothetical protein
LSVADERFRAGVARLGRQHGAYAGRQIGECACGTFREVRKRLGKAGAGGNLHHKFRNVDSWQPGHDSLS